MQNVDSVNSLSYCIVKERERERERERNDEFFFRDEKMKMYISHAARCTEQLIRQKLKHVVN